MRTSIITTCKGRLDHLKQSLPSFLIQDCSVIVVDYSCPDGTFQYCMEQGVTCVQVKTKNDFFNLGHARNCGASTAKTELLAFVDADVILKPSWLLKSSESLLSEKTELVSGICYPGDNLNAGGTCIVTSRLFHLVRGYDEGFNGWGRDDTDFYGRCRRHTKQWTFPRQLITCIQHSDEERVKYYKIKDLGRSCRENARRQKKRKTVVNPSGYGLSGEYAQIFYAD